MRWRSCLGLFIALPLLLGSAAGALAGIPEELKKLDYRVGNFLDRVLPTENEHVMNFTVGKWTTQPISEAIPGLDVLGFLRNRTWINSHGQDQSVGATGGARSRFKMIEWRTELELHYQINPNIKLTGIVNYRYDSVYDWDKRSITKFYRDANGKALSATAKRATRNYMKRFEQLAAYDKDTKRIVRELYADIFFPTMDKGSLSFRLGKQQLGIGKQDFNAIDQLSNAANWRGPSSISSNLEWSRIPTWMANVAYAFPHSLLPGVTVKFVWMPDFESAASNGFSGTPGSANWGYKKRPSTSLAAFNGLHDLEGDKPDDWSLDGSEWAFNLEFYWRGWQNGLWYLSDFQDGPKTFKRPASAGGNIKRHTRREHFMYGTDKSFFFLHRYWLYKYEARFTFGEYMGSKEKYNTSGNRKVNYYYQGHTIRTRFWRDATALALWIDRRLINRHKRSGLVKNQVNIALLYLSYPLESLEDRVSPAVTTYINMSGPATWRQKYSVSYKISDFTKLYFDYTWFTGDSGQGYGIYENEDSFRFGIDHHF